MQLPEERQREPTLCFHTLSIYLCHLSFIDCLWITRLKLGGACHQCRQAKRPASVPCMKACKRLAVVASQSISTKPDKLNCWHYTRSLNNVEVWWSGKDGTKSWKGVCVVIQYIISYTSSYKLQVTVTVTWCGVQNTAVTVISYTKFQPEKSQNIWMKLIPLLPLACWCKESLQDGPQSLTRGHRLLISEIELWMEPTKTQRAKLMIQNSWEYE